MLQETKNLEYCNKALDIKGEIESSFLTLGEYLYNIKEHNLFFPQWDSFLEFCFELKISSNMVNKLIQIHKTLILGYGLTQNDVLQAGGWSAVQEVLPFISSKQDAIKWLKDAGTLTRSDLRKSITEMKTGVDMKNCKHKTFYIVKICNDCGERIRVYEDEKDKK